MKQTIEIEVPNGKKAVWKDNKVVFEDIKPQLPKTWEEFCNNTPIKLTEFYISSTSEISNLKSYDFEFVDKRPWRETNFLPSRQAAEQHLALMQLHQLRDCYRQGWIPNWNNDLENKYCILYTNRVLRICVFRTARRFLAFQSYEIAEEFLNNFHELIEEAEDLI